METPKPRGKWGPYTSSRHRSRPPYPNDETVQQLLHGMDPSEIPTMTDRAAAIAALDVNGTPARAIAERLGCTMRTVQRYRILRRKAALPNWQ